MMDTTTLQRLTDSLVKDVKDMRRDISRLTALAGVLDDPMLTGAVTAATDEFRHLVAGAVTPVEVRVKLSHAWDVFNNRHAWDVANNRRVSVPVAYREV